MLDLVSAILLRLEILNPKALPLWPLFMKLPKASTTSRTWVKRLLRTTSLDAFRMAVGKWRGRKRERERGLQLETSFSWWLICVHSQLFILHNTLGFHHLLPFCYSTQTHRHAYNLKITILSFISNILHDEWSIFPKKTGQLGGETHRVLPSIHKTAEGGNIPNITL